MKTVIYIDVLFAINFIVNLLLLTLTQKLTGIYTVHWRRYLGALVGAVMSLTIFLPMSGWAYEILIRITTTSLVVCATYSPKKIQTIVKIGIVFFAMGFITAGVVIAIWFMLPQSILTVTSGVFYMDISPILLIGCVVTAYVFILLFERVFGLGVQKNLVWSVSITRGAQSASFLAYHDTGNRLIESFSGLPVIIVNLACIKQLLSAEEIHSITTSEHIAPTLRPVFYYGVDSGGVLYSFLPSDITLTQDTKTTVSKAYVAVAEKDIMVEGCTAILGTKVLAEAYINI